MDVNLQARSYTEGVTLTHREIPGVLYPDVSVSNGLVSGRISLGVAGSIHHRCSMYDQL